MDKLKVSTANLVILIAGAVMLIGSFLDFIQSKTIAIEGLVRVSVGGGNEWSSGHFLIAAIPALLGIVMAAEVAIVAFASGVTLPERVLGFSWNQIHLVLGFQATVMMLAFLIQSTGGLGKGIGLFLMLIAAIALLVGAVLRMQEAPSAPPLA
jgi:hypothetical protein